ncbi:polyprenyl synthetase family protein [Desulfovibrio sp. OttesenSCG-928-F07]|nr:polyprenyl synthetase family protein [Desulfovibrio sp. OttesenSCG-928-F07]
MNFKDKMREKTAQVESYLSTCLNLIDMPQGLRTAMNYSLLAGGKRLRPVLCLTTAQLFGLEADKAMPFAASIECIHSYSLVHDDLPAMDNDDLRRGKPSNHKQFGEATAILAGDALVTDAFVLMSSVALAPAGQAVDAGRTLKALHTVALGAGSHGMVGGQYLDMQFTGKENITLDNVREMQAAKTGALITCACLSGAELAGASPEDCARIKAYGLALGAAFQIVDDILDEVGDEAVLGKPVGSDSEMGKVTYPALVGLEKSRELAQIEANKALEAISGYKGEAAVFLRELVEYVLKRAS